MGDLLDLEKFRAERVSDGTWPPSAEEMEEFRRWCKRERRRRAQPPPRREPERAGRGGTPPPTKPPPSFPLTPPQREQTPEEFFKSLDLLPKNPDDTTE